MSNGKEISPHEKCFRLLAKIGMMVADGVRTPEHVSVYLQKILMETKSKTSVFEHVGTVVVPATTSRFVARDKFVVDTKPTAKVKISGIGGNFTSWFLSGEGKIEDPIAEQTLLCYRLYMASWDDLIIKELGGEEKVETTLFEMFSLMEKQGSCERDNLLTNGCWHIFYVKDQSDALRAVSVRWCDNGWYVDAGPAPISYGWRGGYRVFSRQPVLVAA